MNDHWQFQLAYTCDVIYAYTICHSKTERGKKESGSGMESEMDDEQ